MANETVTKSAGSRGVLGQAGIVSSWNQLVAAAPDLAPAVRRRFEAHRHNVVATLRHDGSPRISGIETGFLLGELWLGMMPGSRKAKDLQHDPRVALHAAPIDLELIEGDAKLAGRAVEITDDETKAAFLQAHHAAGHEAPPPGPMHLFRIDVQEISLVRVDGDHLVIDAWREGEDVKRVERR